jgi:hypothetical protein
MQPAGAAKEIYLCPYQPIANMFCHLCIRVIVYSFCLRRKHKQIRLHGMGGGCLVQVPAYNLSHLWWSRCVLHALHAESSSVSWRLQIAVLAELGH